MPFKMMHPLIRQRLIEQGIVHPTKAQEGAIPEILNGSNVLLIAPTGIGKTEAAVLPVLHRYLEYREKFQKEGGDGNPPGINILYITPLRALNRDMLRRMKEWGESLDLKVSVRHGDTTQYERTKQSRDPPDFLITTPETLQIMFTGSKLRKHLENVKWVIIDEIHEMAEDERGAQLSVALERLVERAGEVQRIGLSATVGEPKKVGFFMTGLDRHVSIVKIESQTKKEIIVDRPETTEKDMEIAEELNAWPELISTIRMGKELMEAHESTLFFVNTRDTAEIFASRMKIHSPEFSMGIHHGSLSRDIRVEMEDAFKKGELKTLICTSSMELGIDIGRTDLVIQYNSPRQVERFLQRLGRSGHRMDLVSRGTIIAVGSDEIAESMVIGRRSMKGELEEVDIRLSPVDVCANQMVALTMEYGTLEIERAWGIIKRSYPFRHLKRNVFDSILEELINARVLWSDGENFRKAKNTLGYFYSNISMIPDQRTYLIRDITTRKIVGTLDEAFAITLEEKGTFIIKGNNWNFVTLEAEEVIVEPSADLGILPDWVGEDIPVPYSVAREVGKIRRVLAEKNPAGEEILALYPIKEGAKKQLQNFIDQQINEGISVPTDQLITIENGKRLCIVNACFGSKVNETLGQLLSALISARQGTAVKFRTDPYRIMMESSRRIDPNEVVEIITTFPPSTLRSIMYKVLKNSSFLKWQFFQVARKFGIISRDADLKNIHIKAMMERFTESIVYQEALNKVLWSKMHVNKTQEVLRKIQDGKINTRITPVSPIGMEGLERMKELMNPERASHTILKALKARLENNQMVLVCMNCSGSSRHRIKNLTGPIRCNKCGGSMLAAIPGHDRQTRLMVEKKIRKKAKLKAEERKEIKKLMTNASLLMEYGRKAVIVLSGRGIGPKTAGRILARMFTDEFDMYREILKAEVHFARTHQFWS